MYILSRRKPDFVEVNFLCGNPTVVHRGVQFAGAGLSTPSLLRTRGTGVANRRSATVPVGRGMVAELWDPVEGRS